MNGRRLRAALGLALAAVVLAASGCTAAPAGHADAATAPREQLPIEQLTPVANPRAYEGPSTAVLPEAAITPVAEKPAQRLPATVTSHDRSGDRTVAVADTSRVVAMDLAGSLGATVWGLGFGGNLVGRDVSTIFPGTENLPLVTSGGHSVSAEAVIALRPTLVITDGSLGPVDVIEQLRDVGIAVVFVQRDTSFEGAVDLARQVAAVFGAPEAGERLAQRTVDEIAAVKTQIQRLAPADPAQRVRMVFLYLRGASGVYYLFGSESGADQLIQGLGGVDVSTELGWKGMQPLTDEAMVAANPDLILVMTTGLASVGGVDKLLAAKPAIALTQAGQHRRFVDMADGQILSFGPRSAAVLEALARAIYAPDSL